VDGTIAVILSSRTDPPAESMRDRLHTAFGLVDGGVAAIGQTLDGVDAIHKSYISARETLEYQMITPGLQIYEFGKLPDGAADALPWAVEHALKDLPPILHGKSEARLEAWIEEFLDLAQQHAESPARFKHAVVSFILALKSELKRSRTGLRELRADETVHAVWNGTSFAPVRELAVATARRAHHALRSGADYGHARPGLGEQLSAYVEANASRHELSLAFVADAFKITPSYVSRVFREQVGQSFQDFLTQQRLKAAGARLIEGHEQVSDIAREVGYAEVRTFIRAFKRNYGMTPLEYRRAGAQAEIGAPFSG
jgi:AraC-like DNA-binding protein